jgi:hypothetical protein
MSGTQLTAGGVNRNTARRGGRRDDLGGRYFRSSWEANYARYLDWLVRLGVIKSWEFEPVTFEFPVKRGSRFYTPDFRVTELDGSNRFHEVKGWMDAKSATKLKRMEIHHPTVEIELVDSRTYRRIAKENAWAIPNWERTSRGGVA